MSNEPRTYHDANHEESEERGILSLVTIILGLIGIGVMMYTITWAVAPN